MAPKTGAIMEGKLITRPQNVEFFALENEEKGYISLPGDLCLFEFSEWDDMPSCSFSSQEEALNVLLPLIEEQKENLICPPSLSPDEEAVNFNHYDEDGGNSYIETRMVDVSVTPTKRESKYVPGQMDLCILLSGSVEGRIVCTEYWTEKTTVNGKEFSRRENKQTCTPWVQVCHILNGQKGDPLIAGRMLWIVKKTFTINKFVEYAKPRQAP